MTVSANNTRTFTVPNPAASISSIGGGAGATGVDDPAAFFYTSTGCVYRKITDTGAGGSGFWIQPNSAPYNMTAAATNTALIKFAVTDFGGLNATEGVNILIGSNTTNNTFHEIPIVGSDVAGTSLDLYPAKGGFILLPINPNITAYHRTTGGSANEAAIAAFGITARFASASAKAENLGLTSVDLGTGLNLYTSGTLSDLYDFDEGAQNNRFGYCSQLAPDTYNLFGTVFIAENAGTPTATTITDSSRETWQHGDGLFDAGWSGWSIDLTTSSTITLSNKTLQGIGTTTTVDTRPVFTVTGTTGTLALDASVLSNYASVTLTSAVTVTGCTVVNTEGITHGGASISSTTFAGSPVASGTAMMTSANVTSLSDCSFVSGGTGHAIEITAAGSYDWDGHTYSGYGADGSNNAVIYNNSGGLVTLTILNNASIPTVRNGAGASTNIVANTVTVRVTAQTLDNNPLTNTRVYLKIQGGANDGVVILNGLVNGSGIIQDTGWVYAQDETLVGWARNASTDPYYKNAPIAGTLTASGFAGTAIMIEDV